MLWPLLWMHAAPRRPRSGSSPPQNSLTSLQRPTESDALATPLALEPTSQLLGRTQLNQSRPRAQWQLLCRNMRAYFGTVRTPDFCGSSVFRPPMGPGPQHARSGRRDPNPPPGSAHTHTPSPGRPRTADAWRPDKRASKNRGRKAVSRAEPTHATTTARRKPSSQRHAQHTRPWHGCHFCTWERRFDTLGNASRLTAGGPCAETHLWAAAPGSPCLRPRSALAPAEAGPAPMAEAPVPSASGNGARPVAGAATPAQAQESSLGGYPEPKRSARDLPSRPPRKHPSRINESAHEPFFSAYVSGRFYGWAIPGTTVDAILGKHTEDAPDMEM